MTKPVLLAIETVFVWLVGLSDASRSPDPNISALAEAPNPDETNCVALAAKYAVFPDQYRLGLGEAHSMDGARRAGERANGDQHRQ